MSVQTIPELSQEDAFAYLVTYLRERRQDRSQYPNYGYDLYLNNVVNDFLIRNHYNSYQLDRQTNPKLSAVFMSAAWALQARNTSPWREARW